MKDKIEEALREAYGYGAMGRHMGRRFLPKVLALRAASSEGQGGDAITTEILDREDAGYGR